MFNGIEDWIPIYLPHCHVWLSAILCLNWLCSLFERFSTVLLLYLYWWNLTSSVFQWLVLSKQTNAWVSKLTIDPLFCFPTLLPRKYLWTICIAIATDMKHHHRIIRFIRSELLGFDIQRWQVQSGAYCCWHFVLSS